jgi:hypothetical protein
MKPHEETWTVLGDDVHIQDGGAHVVGPFGDSATAKLAACAPEMARMLMGLSAWGCPICEQVVGEGQEHCDDCELDALLRRAGVR